MEAEARDFIDKQREKVEYIRTDETMGPLPKVALLRRLRDDVLTPRALGDKYISVMADELIDEINKYIYNPELLI